MTHLERACKISLAFGILTLLVVKPARKADGRRGVPVNITASDSNDLTVSKREKDLLNDLLTKVRTDRNPLKYLPYPMQSYTRPPLPSFTADPYIRAAVALQQSTPDHARRALLSLAEDHQSEKVAILCRMLFVWKKQDPFNRLFFGQNDWPGGTEWYDWPDQPIALVEGVPFFLPRTIMVAGQTTPPVEYLEHCYRDGQWNPYRFRLKSAREKRNALNKLFASPILKRPLNANEKDYLSKQIQ